MPGGNPAFAGSPKCQGLTTAATRCQNAEIAGLEYCVLHVPDEYLEEAEDISGLRRCRKRFGEPEACRNYAIEGSDPIACQVHGQGSGSINRQRSAKNVFEMNAAERLAEIMKDGGEKLLRPDPLADPLSELLDIAAEMKALKDVLRDTTAHLMMDNKLRYAHSKAGEMARMEIVLYERAVERFVKVLIDVSKLKIEDRLAGVREATAAMLERALDAALEDSGVGIEGKDKARTSFRRHLKVVA